MAKNRKYLRVGNQIIEGPNAIFPPDSGHDWLEKDISIYLHYYGDNRMQHISLWSDSTMNKEENFLKPVIRFVHWERQNDLVKARENIEINWPDIRIFLGYVKPELFDKLNSSLMQIQQQISKINFSPIGIRLNRNSVTIEPCDYSVDFEVWVRNGIQAMTYYSPVIENDEFSKQVLDLKNLLLQSIETIDHSGWKERYDSPFNSDTFDWDYKELNGR